MVVVFILHSNNPVGEMAEKAVYKSVFLTISHCILSAELIKIPFVSIQSDSCKCKIA